MSSSHLISPLFAITAGHPVLAGGLNGGSLQIAIHYWPAAVSVT
jgi:hypothetical protein